jgi:hypothetical protein
MQHRRGRRADARPRRSTGSPNVRGRAQVLMVGDGLTMRRLCRGACVARRRAPPYQPARPTSCSGGGLPGA